MQRIPPVLLGPHLDLVEVTVPEEGDDTGVYELKIRAVKSLTCPHCQQTHVVRPLQPEPRTVHDLPYGDHPVHLEVHEGRAYCRATKREVLCVLPDRQGKATLALRRYLLRRYGREARAHLAAQTGLSEATIKAIQEQEIRATEQPSPPKQVYAIGVDDIYMKKGRYLVAVNLNSKKILQLAQVGTVIQGRASAVDLASFFKTLPEARVVALDMNAQQYQAAKDRWPKAKIVIDKRHLLQTIDRDLIDLAARVVLDWWDEYGDPVGGQQAVRTFGLGAYPYLALRALVLRRRRSLTPADHAAWVLLRREGPREGKIDTARMLWEAWLWREDLYDIIDVNLERTQGVEGLRRWRERATAWQKQWNPQDEYMTRPLRRILWALERYQEDTEAYAVTGGVTNARTELCNAALRQYLRQGRRYAPETLVNLVNRQPVRRRKASRSGKTITLKRTTWIRAPGEEAPAEPPVEPECLIEPGPLLEPPEAEEKEQPIERIPAPAATQVKRRPRHLPQQDQALALPPQVWDWLHSSTPGGRTTGERWRHRVMGMAAPEVMGSWHHFCAGRGNDSSGDSYPDEHLCRWRAVAYQQYVAHHLNDLPDHERERQSRLIHVNLDRLYAVDPEIHGLAADIYRRLAVRGALPLSPEDEVVLELLENWAGG